MTFESWFYNECLPKITDEARSAALKKWGDEYFPKINEGLKAIAANPDHAKAKKLQQTIDGCNTKIKNNLLAELAQIQIDQEKQFQEIAGNNLDTKSTISIRCGG